MSDRRRHFCKRKDVMNEPIMKHRTRRTFIRAGLIAGASTFAGAMLVRAATEKKNEEEEEVSPAEDLMREHGVLKRVLLIYGEAIRRIDA